ncbi:hypothetical protein EGW08_014196 [Elysia chlorotica]|uniref:Noggin n=1 Tax=Elysia chlorotica TaxID=188477 RepID=A0A3S0ZY35_ELYCH|nr:hypothetical protein EGW08_014196 [Elysia chlorotica]
MIGLFPAGVMSNGSIATATTTTRLFPSMATTTTSAFFTSSTTPWPLSTAQTRLPPAGVDLDLGSSTLAAFSPRGVAAGGVYGQAATGGLVQQDLSPAMLSRIPTIVLAVYIVNSVMANFRGNVDSQAPGFPLLPGLTPSLQNRAGTLQGVEIKERLRMSEIFAPRKFHLRKKRLLKKMGGDFDLAWMSVEQPNSFSQVTINEERDPQIAEEWIQSVNPWALMNSLSALNLTQRESLDVTIQRGSNRRRMNTAVKLVMSVLQDWLVKKATCPVWFVWEDLGAMFWPRYIRKGYCSKSNFPGEVADRVQASLAETQVIEQDCSWPPGMFCVSGEEKRLRLLAWKCQPTRAARERQGSSESSGNEFQSLSDMPKSGKTPAVGGTKGSFQRTLESFGSGRRHAATSESAASRVSIPNQGAGSTGDGSNQVSGDGQDLSSIMSKIMSHRQKRSSIPTEMVGYIGAHSRPQRDQAQNGNQTEPVEKEDYSHLSWRELKSKFKVNCRWHKITLPVTQHCHCSC